MSDTRPVNGPEEAFFAALLVIVKTAIAAGIDGTVLADRLQAVAAAAKADNCHGKAAILEAVAETADRKRYRTRKSTLEVIKGGKG
jgi:hydroxyethylthiazole kinase-like sugar kinase family protein